MYKPEAGTNGSYKNKNIIVLLLDTVRASDAYNNKSLKNLSKLISNGTSYENAISPATWTAPAHASIFTEKLPSHIKEASHDFLKDSSMDPWLVKIKFLPDNAVTLASKLHSRGYYSVLFSNNPFLTSYTNLALGFDKVYDLWMQSNVKYNPKKAKILIKFIEGGVRSRAALYKLTVGITRMFPQQFLDNTYLKLRIKMASGVAKADGTYALDRGAVDTNTAIKSYMQSTYNYKPQFMFINCIEAHENYPVKDRSIVQDKWMYLSGILEMNARILRELHDAYMRRIKYLDTQIGNTISILRDNGLLDNAKVIVTADHGQFFGEHNLLYHAMFPYSEVNRVPLVIADYENGELVDNNAKHSKPISLIEMHKMIMAYASGTNYRNDSNSPVISEHTGISEGWDGELLSMLKNRSKYASLIYKAKNSFNIRSSSIIKGDFKLVHFFGKRKSELYRVNDYSESVNLIDKERSIAKRLASFA